MSTNTKVTLTPEVLDVLNRSEITATTLKLPEQLDRKLYMKVAKVIDLAGGKWMRGRALHVFEKDPREVLGLALESGEILDEKKLFQFYPTPRVAADIVWEMAEVSPDMALLEPSAGDGGLLKAIPDGFFKHGFLQLVELNPAHKDALYAEAKRIVAPSSRGQLRCPRDFLQMEPGPLCLVDRIMMNPPFTKGQAYKHMRHAWRFLVPGGRLTCVLPGGPSNNALFVEEFTTNATMLELEAGTFKEAGTNITTTVVSVDR